MNAVQRTPGRRFAVGFAVFVGLATVFSIARWMATRWPDGRIVGVVAVDRERALTIHESDNDIFDFEMVLLHRTEGPKWRKGIYGLQNRPPVGFSTRRKRLRVEAKDGHGKSEVHEFAIRNGEFLGRVKGPDRPPALAVDRRCKKLDQARLRAAADAGDTPKVLACGTRGDRVVVAVQGDRPVVVALRGDNGQFLWRLGFEPGERLEMQGAVADPVFWPSPFQGALARFVAFAACRDGDDTRPSTAELTMIDVERGEVAWRRSLGEQGSWQLFATVGDSRRYVLSTRSGLVAMLSPRTGNVLATARMDSTSMLSPSPNAIAGDRLWVGSAEGVRPVSLRTLKPVSTQSSLPRWTVSKRVDADLPTLKP